MDLESGYIVSVSRQFATERRGIYRHFFQTDKIPEKRRANEVYRSLCVCYPCPEYHINITHWDIVGRETNASYKEEDY